MSKKRPANNLEAGTSARAFKRVKLDDIRVILTQTSEKALTNNGELDVEAFVKAREFEIRALENNMAMSKKASASRAFQQVPRELRRRTASHNVKRVPKRLRARAAKEMKEDNTPTIQAGKTARSTKQHLRAQYAKKAPDLAKRIEERKEREDRKLALDAKKEINQLAKPKPTVLKHKKRQLNKSWLPTHVWHAKRAQMTPPMEPLWRFAIPLTPTEKTARVTGRSSRLRGCVAWDMSYISTICIEGMEDSIIKTFRSLSVPEKHLSGKLQAAWRSGHRSLRTWVRDGSDKTKLIAQPIFIWQPQGQTAADRRVFIRVQPSAFLQLWKELLRIGKLQDPPVRLEDLRFAIGSIDITGPAALESLVGVLHPVKIDDQSNAASMWSKLAAIQDSYSLPHGAMMNLLISDPRLAQPHQTVPKDLLVFDEAMSQLSTTWPAAQTSISTPIFDSLCRHKAVRSLQTQSAINKRKGAALPGHKPESLPNDPQVPILLVANNHHNKTQAPGSWTLLMPWDCILPTWHSLMHYPLSIGGNPRFGGLDEQRQLCFEDGRAWFPGDFPGTKAGWQWELDQRDKRKSVWDRKPKSKRVEWSTLDLGNSVKGEVGEGWACDWQLLCKGPGDALESDSAQANDTATQIPPSNICQIIQPTLDAAESFPANGLTTISVTLVNRGVPSPCARIYRLPSKDRILRTRWLNQLTAKKDHVPSQGAFIDPTPTAEAIPETQLGSDPGGTTTSATDSDYPAVPSASDLIGFVTSGNFNLAQGKGTGIGCIIWPRMVDEAKKNKSGALHGLCIIRDAGQKVGRLAKWETIS